MSHTFPAQQVIIVGGGLAGLTAAVSVLERGGNVVLLDKMGICGGDSTRACGGISSTPSDAQKALKVVDLANLFVNDILQAGEPSERSLASVLARDQSVQWLSEKFGVDLSEVAEFPGHSVPRTHRGLSTFPGISITYAVLQLVEEVQRLHPTRCRVITHAKVNCLLFDGSAVFGVEYTSRSTIFREFGPVILATGGFSSAPEILAKHRPDLLSLPTSAGEHTTGDGINLVPGAALVDMKAVQLHPLGLIDPEDEQNKFKYVCSELLLGEGAILVYKGKRFCDEKKLNVVSEMQKFPGPFWIIAGSKTANKALMHVEHYLDLKCFQAGGLKDAEREMGIGNGTLSDTLRSAGFDSEDELFYGKVTPVVHYCSGGLGITERGEVRKAGKAQGIFSGLFAAGEVTGGIHGKRRLPGCGLTECIAFGRAAGRSACEYAFGEKAKIWEGIWEVKKIPTAVAAVPAASGTFSLTEVARHNSKSDCWIAVNGQVLDVTNFLKDHPGGELPILSMAGKDASVEFNMIHPSDVIQKYAPFTIKGVLEVPGVKVAESVTPVVTPVVRDISIVELSKHNTRQSCWVAVNGQVLDVTNFLKDHPGGELPILTFAGKDATKEFNMIHPPDVVKKYAAETIIGNFVPEPLPLATPVALGGYPAGLSSAASGIGTGLTAPLLPVAEEQWWGPERLYWSEYGPWGISVGSILRAIRSCVRLVLKETLKTIFTVKNFSIPHDRSGLTRSAVFLLDYAVIHAIGNLHLYIGPDAFNGYAYFLNHPVIYGALALPIELYLLVSALMHVTVGVIRTVKFKSYAMLTDPSLSGQLGLATTGAALFIFLVIHISQFRLVPEYPSYAFKSKWMYPFYCDHSDPSCEAVQFKDLYKMELKLFESKFWVGFYLVSVVAFVLHLSEGLGKVVGISPDIPKREKGKARKIGTALAVAIGAIYGSYPIYCYTHQMNWRLYDREQARFTRSVKEGEL